MVNKIKSSKAWIVWVFFVTLLLVGCSSGGEDVLSEVQTAVPTMEPTTFPSCTSVGQTWTSPVDGMTLLCVPAGEFTMGSNEYENEKPAHTVYLDAFWIDQTEVTGTMYKKCIDAGVCQGNEFAVDESEFRNHPIIHVNWYDADTYCRWAERQLPSEAQWEKAARGTDGRTYPWGNEEPTCSLANYKMDCVALASAVGSYPAGASPYGALDMAGNVWEWVADWYDSGYYKNSPLSNPTGPATGDYRVTRGGSWICGVNSPFCGLYLPSAALRRWQDPDDYGLNFYGFRCSRSAVAP